MFENKNKKIEQLKDTLDEFTSHMNMLSEGMISIHRDITTMAKELNMIKSYIETVVKVFDESDIIPKTDLEDLVKKSFERKVEKIKKNMITQEIRFEKESEDIKHLIEKFKSSISNWFDEDGNPIAKA